MDLHAVIDQVSFPEHSLKTLPIECATVDTAEPRFRTYDPELPRDSGDDRQCDPDTIPAIPSRILEGLPPKTNAQKGIRNEKNDDTLGGQSKTPADSMTPRPNDLRDTSVLLSFSHLSYCS